MNYDIKRKTTSTDAVPEALQNTLYWYDTGTLNEGEAVYYDNTTSAYAYWYNGTDWLISAVADVGGTPTDYFAEQDYPDAITVVGAGEVGVDGDYDVEGPTIAWRQDGGTGRYEIEGYVDGFEIVDLGAGGHQEYFKEQLLTVPPEKTGWSIGVGASPAPTLEYEIPANQFVGQGAYSGTITVGEYVIANAWYRAETTAFESFRSYAGNVEERDCFRGHLPTDGFGDPTDADCWMFTSGGSDVFNIERLYGDNANWCSLRTDARFESVWQTRQKAMDFSGLVMAWLKETGNMREVDSIEWVQLTDITAEPEIYISKGRIPRLFWRVTIPLEMVYKTENIFE